VTGLQRIVAQGSTSLTAYGIANGNETLMLMSPCNAYQGGTASLFFGLNGTGNFPLARIVACDTAPPATAYRSELLFQTNNRDTTLVTRMIINENGNIGIGTSTPTFKLDVVGGSNRMTQFGSATQSTDPTLRIENTNGGRRIDLFTNLTVGAYNPTLVAAGDMGIIFTNGTQDTGNLVIAPWATSAGGLKIMSNGNVGIGTTAPQCKLDVNAYTAGIDGFAAVRSIANDNNSKTCLNNINTYVSLVPCPNTDANLYIYWRGGGSGNTNYRALIAGATPYFTGQHGNVCVTSTITKATLKDFVGLIVSSADEGYVSLDASGNPIIGSNAIWTTEALPKIKLTEKDKDKAVWGVLTNHKNESRNTDGTWDTDDTTEWGDSLGERFRVNGLGEGAIWITNINGPLENGDYICSSVIPGYGRRQDDDLLHNYTVAKITMSCDFTLDQSNYRCEEMEWNGSTFLKAYVGCTYHCS
jgi:hypothetical protein